MSKGTKKSTPGPKTQAESEADTRPYWKRYSEAFAQMRKDKRIRVLGPARLHHTSSPLGMKRSMLEPIEARAGVPTVEPLLAIASDLAGARG